VELKTKPGTQMEVCRALERLVDATHREDRGVVRFEVGLDPQPRSRSNVEAGLTVRPRERILTRG